MIAISRDYEGSWDEKRGAVARDLQMVEAVVNQHLSVMYGGQTAPTQVCYPLGGSISVPVRHAVAHTFVDVPNALDVRLPVDLPPGAVTVIVRVSADTVGVGVTPRLIRTDTGMAVGVGRKVTVVNTPSLVTTWPLCTTQEFLVQPVTHVLGQRMYYRLQVASDVANATVYASGVLVTGQVWQDGDAALATNDRVGAWGNPVIGVGSGGTGTSTAFTPGSVVFAGPAGVYSQDNANLFWDDANNRLGVGTSAPAVRLDVAGDGYFHNTTGSVGVILDASDTGALGVGLRRLGTPAWDMVVGAGANPGLDFRSGAAFTTRLTLLVNGNVGIGTIGPTQKLQIVGGVCGVFSGAASGGLTIAGDWTTGTTAIFTDALGGAEPKLHLSTYSGNASAAGITIVTNGDVGIGTIGPINPLHVVGRANNYALRVVGSPTTGQSYGPVITAGTNTSDQALQVFNQTVTTNLLAIRGDGVVTLKIPPAFTAGDKYVVFNVSTGELHLSALGPAS